jgi:moderate conductance mechanosensitive channel
VVLETTESPGDDLTPLLAADLIDACGNDPGYLCRLVFEVTESERVARASLLLTTPLKILLILLGAYLLIRVIRRGILRVVARLIVLHEARSIAGEVLVERGRQRAETFGTLLRSVTAFAIYTIAVMIVLSEFINIGPLIASAGIVGVALGFGAQSLVRDFLSGVFMIIEDQFGVGDIIDVGETTGVVESVSLRRTQLRSVDGTLWHVPNGEIRRVANKSQQWARAVLDVQVAYQTDLSHAMRVIKEVADELWREKVPNASVIEEPEIWGVEALGENSITIRLAIKVEAGQQWTTARIIRQRLKEAFDREGIEIPFAQRTVWVRQVDPRETPNPLG